MKLHMGWSSTSFSLRHQKYINICAKLGFVINNEKDNPMYKFNTNMTCLNKVLVSCCWESLYSSNNWMPGTYLSKWLTKFWASRVYIFALATYQSMESLITVSSKPNKQVIRNYQPWVPSSTTQKMIPCTKSMRAWIGLIFCCQDFLCSWTFECREPIWAKIDMILS